MAGLMPQCASSLPVTTHCPVRDRFIGTPHFRQTLTMSCPSSWARPLERLWNPKKHSSRIPSRSRFEGSVLNPFGRFNY